MCTSGEFKRVKNSHPLPSSEPREHRPIIFRVGIIEYQLQVRDVFSVGLDPLEVNFR